MAEAAKIAEAEVARLRRIEEYAKLAVEAHERNRRHTTDLYARTMVRLLDNLARAIEAE
jgi:hypothetical protein